MARKRLTQKEAERIYLENGFILTDIYVNGATSHKCICVALGHKTAKYLGQFRQKQKSGCKFCAVSKKYTQEEATVLYLEYGLHLKEIYKTALTKHFCTYIVCGHDTLKRLNDAQQGYGCDDCNGNVKHTQEEAVSIYLEHGFILKDTYLNSRAKHKCLCVVNGHKVTPSLGSVLMGSGCFGCVGKVKYTQEEAEKFYISKGFILIDTYVNNSTSHSCKCVAKNHKVKKQLTHIQQDSGCPTCALKYNKWEDGVFVKLSTVFPHLLPKARVLKNKRFHLDVWDPVNRKAVELDGDYWHDLPKHTASDHRKNKECQDAGIKLLRIKYSQYMKDPQASLDLAIAFLL